MTFERGTRSEVFDCAYPVGTGMRLKDIWQRCDPNGIFGPVQIDQESKSANGNQRHGQNRQFCAAGPWRTRQRQAAQTRRARLSNGMTQTSPGDHRGHQTSMKYAKAVHVYALKQSPLFGKSRCTSSGTRVRFNAMIDSLILPLRQCGPGLLFAAWLVPDNGGVTHQVCAQCGRMVDAHDRHVRFRFPDPVLDRSRDALPDGTWLSHEDPVTSVMMQVPGLGAFVRAVLPVRLTGGYTVTYGVWVSIHPDDLQRAFAVWWQPEYAELRLDGALANALQPWGLLAAPVSLEVRDPEQSPYCAQSPDPLLSQVLSEPWPHAEILDALL